MFVRDAENIKPFPIFVYVGFVIGLVVSGILVSAYLSFSHYKVYTDIGYSSFCAISKAINCDTVSQSPYAIFFNIPVPIWGIVGYSFLLLTLAFSFNLKTHTMARFPTLISIGLLFSSISIVLGIISGVKIKSYCILCLVSYGINFSLLYMTWIIKQRFEKRRWAILFKEDLDFWTSNKLKALTHYSPLILCTILLIIFMPSYWNMTQTTIDKTALNTGFLEDGSPWIGAENPELTIIEYADYMCFQCRKMHFYLRDLIMKNPGKIRLVHKHFPMDQDVNPIVKKAIHPGSGILSSIAIFAAEENKFWELNDYLYQYNMGYKAIYLRKIAKETGLDLEKLRKNIHSSAVRKKLHRDIISGLKHQMSGTPSYIIENKVYTGQIPSEVLYSIIK